MQVGIPIGTLLEPNRVLRVRDSYVVSANPPYGGVPKG